MNAPGLHWLIFGGSIALLLSADLYVHRGEKHTSRASAVIWSVIWITAGLLFSLVVMALDGSDYQEYVAAYAMEKSLSLDNMFVFLLIFQNLQIPPQHQHTALAWGIFGALVFRALFIFIGAAALERWDAVRYVFGGVLVLAACQAWRGTEQHQDSKLVRWLSSKLPISQTTESNDFLVVEDGKRLATPLLVALLAIEFSDVAFAIDSVPAALSVTRDRFIVYSSNAFAILGLRALYLAVQSYLTQLKYLHYGLSAVLAFAATKLIAGDALRLHPLLSVGVVVVCIGAAAGVSLWQRGRTESNATERG